MSESENEEPSVRLPTYAEVIAKIDQCKRDPETSDMFVSGWDDADEDVEPVKDPKANVSNRRKDANEANPVDHVLWAAENGHLCTIKKLLEKQPDLVHAQDSDGYTPLHRAAYSNHLEVISYLVSSGAKIHAKTQLGWTPLHSACNWNNYEAAARLLAAGADPAAVSDGDQTAMHLAAAISHCKSTLLILFLREDTVDLISKLNNAGETPEKLAQGRGIYGPLFEMLRPSVSYIKSVEFTCNPYVRYVTEDECHCEKL